MSISPLREFSDDQWLRYLDLKENKQKYMAEINTYKTQIIQQLRQQIQREDINEKERKTATARENARKRKKAALDELGNGDLNYSHEINEIIRLYNDLGRKVGLAASSYMMSQYDTALSTIARNTTRTSSSNPYIIGGIVNGIAGPVAGLHAAYRTDQKNQAIKSSLEQNAKNFQNSSAQNYTLSCDYRNTAINIIRKISYFLDNKLNLKEVREANQQKILERLKFEEKEREQRAIELKDYKKKLSNFYFVFIVGLVPILIFLIVSIKSIESNIESSRTAFILLFILVIYIVVGIVIMLYYESQIRTRK